MGSCRENWTQSWELFWRPPALEWIFLNFFFQILATLKMGYLNVWKNFQTKAKRSLTWPLYGLFGLENILIINDEQKQLFIPNFNQIRLVVPKLRTTQEITRKYCWFNTVLCTRYAFLFSGFIWPHNNWKDPYKGRRDFMKKAYTEIALRVNFKISRPFRRSFASLLFK